MGRNSSIASGQISASRETTLWHSQAANGFITLDAAKNLSEELRASLLEWKQREAKFQRLRGIHGYLVHGRLGETFGLVSESAAAALPQGRGRNIAELCMRRWKFEGKPGYLKAIYCTIRSRICGTRKRRRKNIPRWQRKKLFDEGSEAGAAAMWFATPWAFLQSFFIRAGFSGRTPRSFDRANGGAIRGLKFRKLGTLVREERNNKITMRFFCGLDREWRGGRAKPCLLCAACTNAKLRLSLWQRVTHLGNARPGIWIAVHALGAPRLARLAAKAIQRLVARNRFDLSSQRAPC